LGEFFIPQMFPFDVAESYLSLGQVLDLMIELEKTIYCNQVISLWTYIGGEQVLPTRDWKTNKLDNDLMRFFRAVVSPVMKGATPSDESIPGYIKAQRLIERRLGSLKRTVMGELEPIPPQKRKRR
jgi:hypothetical protein